MGTGTAGGQSATTGLAGAASPIARVVLEVSPAHLDRPFDYLVPDGMGSLARPGVRVRVRFAGQDVDGFVLERRDTSDHTGRLSPLIRVVSPERVLTPDVARLARAVADRYLGTMPDVLRLAVPPRHAATEAAAPLQGGPEAPTGGGSQPWEAYPAGAAFLARLRRGEAPRAVWAALPGASHWAQALAEACEATLDSGRGAVVVLPDRRDVDALDRALATRLGPGRHARLEADLGPAERYRAFLACLRGQVRVAIGTRSAAYAPIADLGLVAIWDDGDDSHAEQRAPYPHSREVLLLRAGQAGAAALIGGWTISAEGASLIGRGWARPIEADRTVRRRAWARVSAVPDRDDEGGPSGVRLPSQAWRAVQSGLESGPVLIQVPRAGYLPALACATCRRPARCPHCSGPLQLDGPGRLGCRWCGRTVLDWSCPHCRGHAVRARRVGAERTREELGRAFPGMPVVVSRPDRELPLIDERPAIVVATPGVEPVAGAGYAAAVLLDGDLLLAREDVRADEDALRRWSAAVALVRSGEAGGRAVVVVSDAAAPAVQALVRGDPRGFAERLLAERTAADLPPARTLITLEGERSAAAALLEAAVSAEGWPEVDRLGPIVIESEPPPAEVDVLPVDEPVVRWVLRLQPSDLPAAARCLRAALVARSARRERASVRVRVDPPTPV
ncbi:MAG: primosomal protein N' [Kineosporiaceae bacterium]|nr:primosomal protein N' [Kineosporiaceae bacterium]